MLPTMKIINLIFYHQIYIDMKTFKHYASCLFAATLFFTGCQNSNGTGTTDQATTATDSLTVDKDTDNPVLRTIMERRSIRKYKTDPVPREKMDIILRCGINAPSAMNGQPWEVRVVDNPEFIDGVTKLFVESAKDDERMLKMVQDPGFKNMFHNAPAVIFIAGKDGEGKFDCGLLSENIMLAAHAMGLGTCCLGSPIGFMKSDLATDYRKRLDFSEGYELYYAIAIGYPDESPEAKPRDASKVRYVE